MEAAVENTGRRNWTRYLVPGFIFQSVTIAGGYGTGAEIAQYFGVYGLAGGLMGLAVTLVVWSVICAVAFKFARMFKTYDYGSMMEKLLGPASVLYDICYYVMMLIVMGVINATAGSMIHSLTGISPWIGVFLLSAGVVLLVLKGTVAIEKVLSFWSYVLYAVYILFMIVVFTRYGSTVSAELAKGQAEAGWLSGGLRYSFYNLVVVPMVLYTVRDTRSSGEAAFCGAIAGVIGVIPAVFLLLTMGCSLAQVTAAETPVTVIFSMINMKWLYVLFEIVLFGTLIETGTGFIKAVADRVENGMARRGHKTGFAFHAGLTIFMTVVGVCISSFGLTGLIAKGYGTACWGFLFLFAIPMVTVGIWKMVRAEKSGAAE